MSENKNPYKGFRCRYVYDYCDPKSCVCSMSMKWERENSPENVKHQQH